MNDSSILDKWMSKASELKRPMQASIELTHICDLKCGHCYIDNHFDDPKKTLSFEQWTTVLDKLKDAGVLYLTLMGGEATLHKDFFRIAQLASNKGFCVSLITNGQSIVDLEYAKRLKRVGVSNISFSLYSLNPSIHDAMTKVTGSHNKIISAIEFCEKTDIKLGVNCLLTSINIDSFYDLAYWCLEKKIEIKDDPNITCTLEGSTISQQNAPTDEQLKKYYLKRVTLWPSSRKKVEPLNPDSLVCNVARGKCAVTPYGDLLGCIELRESFGNLLESDFKDIWFSKNAEKIRNFCNKDIKGLLKLDSAAFCAHCPALSQLQYGDPLKLSSDMIRIAKIKNSFLRLDDPCMKVLFEGISMIPTLRSDDRLIVKIAKSHKPERGDILFFKMGTHFVAHRVVSFRGELKFKGDRAYNFDAESPYSFIGVITGRLRGSKLRFWGIEGQPNKRIYAWLSEHSSKYAFRPIRWGILIFMKLFALIFPIGKK